MVDDLISRRALREDMYHQAFETDTEMQRWDAGCWIRYKMFENAIESAPPIETINGYNIRFLQQIAAIALSQNITPAEAIEIMRDANRLISFFIKEQNKKIEECIQSFSSRRNYGGIYEGLMEKDADMVPVEEGTNDKNSRI